MEGEVKANIKKTYESSKDVHAHVGQDIGSKFLKELDGYLAKNWRKLTCARISEIYFDFWEVLKPFKGTSSGFTGLSEFLILRLLLHQLGDWEVKDRSQDTRYFQSKYDANLCIASEYPITIEVDEKGRQKKRKPDIVIYEPYLTSRKNLRSKNLRRLISIVEIKVFLTKGRTTAENTIRKLKAIHGFHPEMRALLILFDNLSDRGDIWNYLQDIKTTNQWFDFCSLKENSELLWKVLQKGLDLERTKIASHKKGYAL